MSNAAAAHLKAAQAAADVGKSLEAAIVQARALTEVHKAAAQLAADATHELGLASGEIQSESQKLLATVKANWKPALIGLLFGSAFALGTLLGL